MRTVPARFPRMAVWTQVGVMATCALEAYSVQVIGTNASFVVAVLTVVLMALRHRAPAVLAFVAGPAMGLSGLTLAPVVMLFTAGHRELRRWVLLVLVAWTVISGVLLSPWPPEESLTLDLVVRLAGGVVLQSVLIAGAVGLGQLLRAHQVQTAMVTELIAGRARERVLAEHAARADERADLAREMHDVVASQITLIAVQAGALRMVSAGDQRVQEIAEAIRVAAARTTRELREVLLALREDPGTTPVSSSTSRATHEQGTTQGSAEDAIAPGSSATPSGVGSAGSPALARGATVASSSGASAGAVSLAGVGELWRTSGCRGEVVVHLPTEVAVPLVVHRAGYRIVQEGLTNAVRYAPGAQVRVGVEVVAATVVVSVINGASPVEGLTPVRPFRSEQQSDQPSEQQPDQAPLPGCLDGLPGLSTGHGLRGVRERAEAIGGHANWGPLEGGGFQLVAVLPLSR